MRRTAVFAFLAVLFSSLAACGGSTSSTTSSTATATTALPSSVPKPDLAKIVPLNYVVKKVWYANLTGQAVPDAVVSSKGPAVGELGFHPAELQVVAWDPIAKRWNVAFDGQKVKALQQQYGTIVSNEYVTYPPDIVQQPTAIIDPTADGNVGQVAFVRFGSEKTPDLVFTTTQSVGGSGTPGNLVVVGFQGGEANIRYLWFGDGGVGFRVVGSGPSQTLDASAEFWTPVDAHCCPIRTYAFVVGAGGEQGITSIRDDRAWLGLLVKAVRENESNSPLEVVDVVAGSPAAALFRKGDTITSLVNAPKSENQGALGPALIDQIALLKAGTTASFRVIGASSETNTVTVKLGSLIDPSAQSASPPSDFSIIAI